MYMKKSKWASLLSASLLATQVVTSVAHAQEKKAIDCSALPTRTETYNGKQYLKYNISDSAQMRCAQVQAKRPVMNWKVKKVEWNAQDELAFGDFIKALGNSKCNTTDKCLSGSSNILRTEEDMLFTHYSDCADFPYYLRSYFAYKNKLPFTMVTSFKQAPYSQAQLDAMAKERANILATKGEEAAQKYDARLTDNRYSRNGNIPTAKLNVPSSSGAIRDFAIFGPKIMDQVSSGTMRMLNGSSSGVESDFYSPVVSKDAIKPGTVLYSAAGHVAIVYDVTAKGEVLFIDAHPDNSISRGRFNADFALVNAKYGGNFKNFRPVRVENAVYDNEGFITKGQVTVASDAQIKDFSLEQYEGTARSSAGKTVFQLAANSSSSLDFYEWVKMRLSGGSYRLDPIGEMKNEMAQLCTMAQDRVAAVQVAIDNQVHTKAHPDTLPQNIFGADGEWEAYSTPSRDMRLKLKILSIPEAAKSWFSRYKSGDQMVSYKGADLKADLIKTYQQGVAACKIVYKNSAGKDITVGLDSLIARISRVSYDPYACPEIRWGAVKQEELASCVDSQEKMEWNSLQQFLRNNLVKDTDAFHGYNLDQLRQMNERKEVDNNNSSERFRIGPKLEAM